MENRNISLDREIYKQRLIQLYESSTGRKVNRDNLSDIQRVVYYFHELHLLKKYYKRLLDTFNVDYNQEKVVEVGVGPVDSIFSKDNTTIVSPYIGLFPKRSGKTYEGSYVVNNGEIEMLEKSKRKFEVETSPLELDIGRVYITNNIIDPYSLNSLYKLSPRNRIVVGAYGLYNDCDRTKKRELLRKFGKNLDEYTYNSSTGENGYFEIVQGRAKSK